ncbi:right-handed parallel beta-helix repeat-containing protein [Azospirillum agricola]|uniref:right-handed parallel beta-helix repeat-containing protein n=1 Tax=Azospirillum agricola TaxID=1720247 RepID=UPI000A0F3F4B|nr:right-handed parallel beta-helix repeat-containing protein [Azospirillum agricola]SMH41401.1 parallel beta-helix repeat (two copies) [Azospirillum lipoferum]
MPNSAFFVAANGNDSWSGLLDAPNADGTDGPFASPERALAAMRTSGIKTTYLRGGTYTLASTLTLGAADSGVSLLGYPGEVATLSGGERITGFTSQGGGLYAASVSRVTGLDLSIGGVRQKVAQSGDWTAGDATSGWQVLEQAASGASKTALRYQAGAQVPAAVQAGMMIQTFDTERLSDGIAEMAGIDPASRTITLKTAAQYALRSGGTYRVLNDDALIRDAGEFAWQAETGRLIVKPADAAALLAQGAVVPRLDTLVRLSGASGVTISGLAFADTPYTGTAIDLRGASGNRLSGNYFSNLGTAITLNGSSNNSIDGNRMEHLGAGGIQITYGSNGNIVSGNRITDIGTVRKDVSGVSLYGVQNNTISGNSITDSPRYGISLKNWDANTGNVGNVIEYNRIVNTGSETADSAAIEMLGRSNLDTRTIIRGNYIDGVRGLATDSSGNWLDRQKSFGVYLDDMTNGVTVTDNFIRNTGWASVFVHGGDANRIDNNVAVLANPRERFVRLEWAPLGGDIGRLADNSITRNIITSTTGNDYWELWTPGSFAMSGNLVQGGRGYNGAAGGTDTQADPLFANPGAGNYSLQAGSTAFALGIHDLDWARMGVASTAPITPVAPVVPASPGSTNHAPVVAPNGAVTTREGMWSRLGIAAPTDPDGDALSITVAALPAGTVRLANGTPVAVGTALSAADLTGLTHAALPGLDGDAGVFAYTVADGRGGTATGAVGVTSVSQASQLAGFDPLRYLASNPDLAGVYGTDTAAATRHYLAYGRSEGRPTASFDPVSYMGMNPDVVAAYGYSTSAATWHYLMWGKAAGRPTEGFDALSYIAANPAVADAYGADPIMGLHHYLTWGKAAGMSDAGFDGLAYIASYDDLMKTYGANASMGAFHYVQWGRQAGRTANFDPLEYLASYGDLMDAYGTDGRKAAENYIRWGHDAGRTASFDGLAYIASHPELAGVYGLDTDAAALHYIRWGRAAGWGTSFDPQAYMAANPDVAAAAQGDADAATRNYILWGHAAGRATSVVGTTAAVKAAAAMEFQAGTEQLILDASSGTAVALMAVPIQVLSSSTSPLLIDTTSQTNALAMAAIPESPLLSTPDDPSRNLGWGVLG